MVKPKKGIHSTRQLCRKGGGKSYTTGRASIVGSPLRGELIIIYTTGRVEGKRALPPSNPSKRAPPAKSFL